MAFALLGTVGAWAQDKTPEFSVVPPVDVTAGWYQLKWVDTGGSTAAHVASDVQGKFVANYQQDVTVDGKLYPLCLNEAPTTLDQHAKTFVYFDFTAKSGNFPTGSLLSSNGHYIQTDGSASLTKPTAPAVSYIIYMSSANYPNNSVISTGLSGTNRVSLVPMVDGETSYIGQTEANKYPMVQFSPVNLEDLDLQAWTVSIIGQDEELSADNIQVKYIGEDIYGLTSVYNNGTFFLSDSVVPDENNFFAPLMNGIVPTIQVDADSHIIQVSYADPEYLKTLIEQASAAAGSKVGQYAATDEFISALTQAQTVSEKTGATATEIVNAIVTLKEALNLLPTTSTLNIPTPGTFLRIKGLDSGKYIAAGTNASVSPARYNMTYAEDATTIFYYDAESHLVNLSSGQSNGMNATSWEWVYGENASTVTFKDGKIDAGYGYAISSGESTTFFHDGGTDYNATTRGGGISDIYAQGDLRYRSWLLEEITTLPITVGEAGYATLWTPVALEIPTSGIEVYTGTVSGDYLVLDELTGVIPANTAVVLKNEGTYNFNVAATEGTPVESNALKGGVGLATPGNILTLQQPADADVIGFYSYTGTGLAGFKAYLENVAGIKGLTFSFGTTDGIVTVESATKEDAAIYNLAGQRVEKAVKGVYIINGKKVLVK